MVKADIKGQRQNSKAKISRKEFLNISRLLHAYARSLGSEIKISYTPFSWSRVRNSGVFSGVGGYFNPETKTIRIKIRGRPSKRDILFVMRHELRHLEHKVSGIYRDYYRLNNTQIHRLLNWKEMGIRKPRIKLPCLDTAVKAERDCDRVANLFLVSLGLKPLETRYGYTETFAYRLHQAVNPSPYLR